jgi:hypothetical protein
MVPSRIGRTHPHEGPRHVSASTEIDGCHRLIAGTDGVQIDSVSDAMGVQDLGHFI